MDDQPPTPTVRVQMEPPERPPRELSVPAIVAITITLAGTLALFTGIGHGALRLIDVAYTIVVSGLGLGVLAHVYAWHTGRRVRLVMAAIIVPVVVFDSGLFVLYWLTHSLTAN